jgi:hypothetical protein
MSTFQILICGDDQYVIGESGEETLIAGQTWAFSGASGAIICGTVIQPSPGVPNYVATTQYSGCGECLNSTLEFITAGTPYEACVICCPCGTGSTVTSVSTPHPVWTGLNGQVVVQANAVELGGMNGLYS